VIIPKDYYVLNVKTGIIQGLKSNKTKPDGMPRKLLDVDKIEGLGWKARTSLGEGIKIIYEWFFRA